MTFPGNLLLFAAALFLSSAAYAAPRPAFQFGYGYQQNRTITCSSDDGKRHYCNIDTRGGIQLTRQISDTACVPGQTWGYDTQGVWVNRGCRAEFTANTYGQGSGYGNGQTISCSSDDADDSKPHHCNIDTRGGLQLTRQLSGSPCIQGQTWGYDNQGVWVSRGCRAEFTSGGGGNGYGPGYGYGQGQSQGQSQGQTISCSSDDGKRHYCGGPLRGQVQLARQISSTPCIEGQTWGHTRRGIWVDRGCRAEFTVNTFTYGAGQGYGQTITCSSDDGSRHYCNANTSGGVQLTRQISGSACVQGQTWGYDNQGIWVDRGCRGEFRTR